MIIMKAADIGNNSALVKLQCKKSTFFLVVGAKVNDCRLCILQTLTFEPTMTELLEFSPSVGFSAATTRSIPMLLQTNKNQCGFSLLSKPKTQTVGAN